MRALAFVILVAGCGGGSPPRAETPPTASTSTCLADRVPRPLRAQDRFVTCEGTETSCRSWCLEGDRAGACLGLAYLLEQEDSTQADALALYAHACELGDPSACTNYGAYLVQGSGGAAVDETCAMRLHELTCDAGDSFGCGMVGLALADGRGVAADLERAREVLEASCVEHGYFACAVLGMLQENGRFGEAAVSAAGTSYLRACETGYSDACDDAERLATP